MKKRVKIALGNELLLNRFESHLRVLGYSKVGSSGVRELLQCLEQEGLKLKDVDHERLESHVVYLRSRPNQTRCGNLAVATVRSYVYELRLFFDYLHKLGELATNPMGRVYLLELESKSREVLSRAEIRALYEVCENVQERALLGLFYGCGLRKSEAEKLNIKDVDHRGRSLYVRSGKGRKRRVVPLGVSVNEDLKAYRMELRPLQYSRWTSVEDRKAYMLNKRGGRMRGESYWEWFKKLLGRTSIDKKVSLHHLRHSIATHLLEGGMSIERVRDFLGHEYLETTQIYARVHPDQLPD